MTWKKRDDSCYCCNPDSCPNGKEYNLSTVPGSGCRFIGREEIRAFSIEALDKEIQNAIEKTKQEEMIEAQEETKTLLSDRREQVNGKEGTINDPKVIAQKMMITTILKEHSIAQRFEKDILRMAKGVEWILFPVRSGELTTANKLLAIEYEARAISSNLYKMRNPDLTTIKTKSDTWYVIPNPNRFPLKAPRFPLWAKK